MGRAASRKASGRQDDPGEAREDHRTGGQVTVAELIVELRKLPPHVPVLLAGDPEGNNFAALSSIESAGWDGYELGLLELTDELRAVGYDNDDVHGEPVAVLWP